MPIYEYVCPVNGMSLEVTHPMTEKLSNWGELCALAGADLGNTAASAPVERLIFMPGVSSPAGNSHLKNLGFTKLVRRDSGVYENVTATNKESRYVKSGDASTLPDLKSKITD